MGPFLACSGGVEYTMLVDLQLVGERVCVVVVVVVVESHTKLLLDV